MTSDFQARIEQEYRRRGDTLGWRLLYSPAEVLRTAPVAFIGLNPGGNVKPADHAEFSMKSGSAYVTERWAGSPPGSSKLQLQVRQLFTMLGVKPEDVLAGNLVPFRSPNWDELGGKDEALSFGKHLWRDILAQAQPATVVAMGSVTCDAVRALLGVTKTTRIPLQWGAITGERGSFSGGRFVGLPHLSRYTVMTRSQSAQGLANLLFEK